MPTERRVIVAHNFFRVDIAAHSASEAIDIETPQSRDSVLDMSCHGDTVDNTDPAGGTIGPEEGMVMPRLQFAYASNFAEFVAGTLRARQLAVQAMVGAATLGPLPGTPGIPGAGEARGQVCQYQITAVIQGEQCGVLGFGNTSVDGLNANGEVVGTYGCPGGVATGFHWSLKTGLVILDLPDWLETASPHDIADDGTIVGGCDHEVYGQRGFHYKDGVWTVLPPVDPDSGWSRAQAVSPDGQFVVGRRSITSEVNPYNAFIWDAKTGEMLDLGVINGPYSEANDVNAMGMVVGRTGTYLNSPGDSPFIYLNGKLDIPGPAPGALYSFAVAVNTQDQTFCTSRMSSNPSAGVPALYASGMWTEYPGLDGYSLTVAADLNDFGVAVGAATVSPDDLLPTPRACVWINGNAHDVNKLIPGGSGLELWGAGQVNNAGQILCSAHDALGDNVGVLLTPIGANAADLNGDCQVDSSDLMLLIEAWGPSLSSFADFNRDGTVAPDDLAFLLANWGIRPV